MTQYEAVTQALGRLGGVATLAQLYEEVPKIPGCSWQTKTPQSIYPTNCSVEQGSFQD